MTEAIDNDAIESNLGANNLEGNLEDNQQHTTFSSACNANGVLTVTIDVPNESMNIFNRQVIEEFSILFDTIAKDKTVKAVIFTSNKPGCFIAGADINMLQKVSTAEEGSNIVRPAHVLLQKISLSKKPFIAAIDGVCLGAGYELSLACHYRIASQHPHTKIGLPEVMIGLLPGATGTSKLTRLIGLPQALDLLLTGKQLDAKRAYRAGLVDEVVPASILLIAAERAAARLMKHTSYSSAPKKTLSAQCKTQCKLLLQKATRWGVIKDLIIHKARQQVIKKTKGLYPAPLAILDLVQQSVHLPLKQALKLEANAFGKLTVTAEAKQLINIYFATTELKKTHFTAKRLAPKTINHLGVLGGGLMGAGIATVSIDKAQTPVRIKDLTHDGLLKSHQHIDAFFKNKSKRKIISKEAATQKINLLTGSIDYSGFANCDLIIEAVFEDLKLKQTIINEIESLGNTEQIIASNTSSIPLHKIAKNSQRPENIIGMHYFSPVEKMPLLEIITHKKTSDKTIATAVNFGRKQGKTVIVVSDDAGFYVNRILAPYLNAALELGLEGVALDHIDHALVNAGFPVGPFKLLDEVGIDVGSKIMPILEEAFGSRMKSPNVANILIQHQRLGKKVGKGFYRYDDPKAKHEIDIDVYALLNIQQHKIVTEQYIVDRCLYRMLNEAAFCLEENIIRSCRDGDIGAIFGIGFPPFLGGPFRYMDTLGISQLVKQLQHLSVVHGEQYSPAKCLIHMADNQKNFY